LLDGGGDNFGGESRDPAPAAEFGRSGDGAAPGNDQRKGGAAVWVGEVGIVERELEPLPLAGADTDTGRAPVDESGASSGGVFV